MLPPNDDDAGFPILRFLGLQPWLKSVLVIASGSLWLGGTRRRPLATLQLPLNDANDPYHRIALRAGDQGEFRVWRLGSQSRRLVRGLLR